MVVRQEQMTMLSERSSTGFEVRMREHLRRCFPEKCASLGENGVQESIRFGMERAARYGITLQRDVCRYVDLIFALGRTFDSDPRSRWASDILEDESIKSPTTKVEKLYAAAKVHESPAAGSWMQ